MGKVFMSHLTFILTKASLFKSFLSRTSLKGPLRGDVVRGEDGVVRGEEAGAEGAPSEEPDPIFSVWVDLRKSQHMLATQ